MLLRGHGESLEYEKIKGFPSIVCILPVIPPLKRIN